MPVPAHLVTRLKNAWSKIPPAEQARLMPMIRAAHYQARQIRSTRTGTPVSLGGAPSELALLYSVLHGDPDALLATLDEEFRPYVDGMGNIWGTGKYQQLDWGWLEAAAEWLEHIDDKVPFPQGPASIVQMLDEATIAVIGDWGAGDWGTPSNRAACMKIRDFVADHLKPDYTIHLGDVYYSGTRVAEETNLIATWPRGQRQSFALNSNHEMYPGGTGYFENAVGRPPFDAQKQASYFALENSHWIIVGLDSAYYSDIYEMYMSGSLDAEHQLPFLKRLARSGKQVIVMTHHNGLAGDGERTTVLWDQVMAQFPHGTAPAYWYWGHLHAGIAYAPRHNGLRPRCVGHGAIPWGDASDLRKSSGIVEWFECTPARDPDNPVRVMNGFVLLTLKGKSMSEVFYNEDGKISWAAPAQR